MKLTVKKFLAIPFAKHQQEYTDYKMARLPRHWRENAIAKHANITRKKGIKAANDWLHELIEPLEMLLDIAADDDDIKALSVEIAFKCREQAAMLHDKAHDNWQELCIKYAVRYPIEQDRNQIKARLTDDLWWLRNLRNSHAKAREVAAINAGLVHRKASLYCSDDTLERRGQQLRRNAATLEGITLQSESGQIMKLGDIADAGMANADNRRAELMTRITGFEELASKYGHVATFVTLTCPSRMHAVTKDGKANPKYDGTKPDAAQKYMVECWARARAKLARVVPDGLRFYGLRVCEPHHDATPHWHMILFCKPTQLRNLKNVIRDYFIADSRQEIWNDITPRVKFVDIKPSKGTAAGYIVKYVCKNLGGIEGEKSDEGEATSQSVGARVEAWATTWRIRQFQQVGGHSVTVWRELRRVSENTANAIGGQILKAWAYCQKIAHKKASFAGFIEAMGGLEMPPRESRICLDDDYITKKGRYGETSVHVVLGVRQRFGRDKAANNRERWVRL